MWPGWFCLIEVQGDSQHGTGKEGIPMFVLFPNPPHCDTLRFNQATVKTTITHNDFQHCCISLLP